MAAGRESTEYNYALAAALCVAAPSCGVSYGEVTLTVDGPGGIAGGQFSYSGVFSFTGRLDTPGTASGAYTVT